MRILHLALYVVLLGGLSFSAYQTTEAKRNEADSAEQLHAVISERNELMRERDELKLQIERTSADTSKLRDMLAFHMRACR